MPKILFIRGGAIGDFILTLPAIQLVREGLPDCEIEILGYPAIAELAVSAGLAHRVRSIEHAALAPFFAPESELDEEMCAYLSEFNVVFSYLYDPDQIFQNNLVRAGVKTLFCGPYRMDESEPHQSAAVQLAKPQESLALYLDEPWVELSYKKGETNFQSKSNPLIAVHPGSGSPTKNWSHQSWSKVITELHQKHSGAEFLITSGEAEHSAISDFLQLIDAGGVRYRHLQDLPLHELGIILQQADLFLGHDSGISHLAASVGTQGLILFGPTNPAVWAPPHPAFDFVVSSSGNLSGISVSQVMERIGERGF